MLLTSFVNPPSSLPSPSSSSSSFTSSLHSPTLTAASRCSKMRRRIPFAALTLLVLISLSSSAALTTDGLTLLVLRSAVSSDPTRVLSAWSESESNPCSWPGVSCSPRGLVTALSLPGRSFSGYLPSELSLLTSLQTLDLSNNRLAGRLPAEIGNLTALSRLDLSSNSFNGSLPPSIAALPNLSGVLNLSFNSFSGQVPAEYGRIPVTVSLDLRGNDLSGEIPQVGSLLSQGPTAFAGNPNLCGFPLKVPCGGGGGGNPNPYSGTVSDPDVLEPRSGSPVLQPVGPVKRRAATAATATILAGIIFAALVSVIVLQWQFRKKRGSGDGKSMEKGKGNDGEVTVGDERREGRIGEIYVTVDEGFALELEELLRASSYVVGKSKSGIVYKVVVGRGLSVAVRRLSEGAEGEGEGDEWKKRRSFETEAMVIGRAIHPNVVRLRAYYYAPDEKLLIYDYIPNGTLHSALHSGQLNPTAQPLPWATRLAIIQGAAQGLAFLHECSPRKYIHGNIKTSKFLLDDDNHPYISGFGLTRLLSGTHTFTHSLTKKLAAATSIQCMLGPPTEYLAPEARVPGTPATQKCDVYAFGIVLLEVLTGRMPGCKLENGHVEVEGFVRKAFKEERPLSEVIDPALLREVHAKKQVLAVFHVALGCTESDPDLRPRMRAVSDSLDRVGSSN